MGGQTTWQNKAGRKAARIENRVSIRQSRVSERARVIMSGMIVVMTVAAIDDQETLVEVVSMAEEEARNILR